MMMLNALAFPPLLTVQKVPVQYVKQATIVDVQLLQPPNAFLHPHIRALHALMTQIVFTFQQLLIAKKERVSSVKSAIIVVAPAQVPSASRIQVAIVVNQSQVLPLVLTTNLQLEAHLLSLLQLEEFHFQLVIRQA